MKCICRDLIVSQNCGENVKCPAKVHVCCCRKIFEVIRSFGRGVGMCSSTKAHDCICDVCPPGLCSASYGHRYVNNNSACCIIS